jgi:hypothetical protein
MRREIDAGGFTVTIREMGNSEMGNSNEQQKDVDKKPCHSKQQKHAGKRPYHAPAFQFEKVFEVSALACGKVSPTEGICHNNLRVS